MKKGELVILSDQSVNQRRPRSLESGRPRRRHVKADTGSDKLADKGNPGYLLPLVFWTLYTVQWFFLTVLGWRIRVSFPPFALSSGHPMFPVSMFANNVFADDETCTTSPGLLPVKNSFGNHLVTTSDKSRGTACSLGEDAPDAIPMHPIRASSATALGNVNLHTL